MSRYSPANAVVAPSKWKGKKAVFMGDSITYQFRWQPYLESKFGLTTVNQGISGTRIADLGDTGEGGTSTTSMCRDERINALDANADLVIVMGGTNDWAQSVQMGTIDSTDVTTFYGALNVMMGKLFARFPTARIVLNTTPCGTYPTRFTASGGVVNNAGFSTRDYADAVLAIGKKYSVPVIDVHAKAGWNSTTIANYMDNDGAWLHPTAALGAKRLAEVVVGELQRIEPVI